MTHNNRLQRRTDRVVWTATLLFAGFAGQQVFAAEPELHARECGDCHVAYAPRLLSATEWRRITDSLDRHYGVDATLDAPSTATLARWLEVNARPAREAERASPAAPASPAVPPGAAAKPVPDLPRITTSRWFLREHDEIDARSWKLPAIGSPSNCGACHTDATRGRYDERALRLPTGVISREEDEHERHESRRR